MQASKFIFWDSRTQQKQKFVILDEEVLAFAFLLFGNTHPDSIPDFGFYERNVSIGYIIGYDIGCYHIFLLGNYLGVLLHF